MTIRNLRVRSVLVFMFMLRRNALEHLPLKRKMHFHGNSCRLGVCFATHPFPFVLLHIERQIDTLCRIFECTQ